MQWTISIIVLLTLFCVAFMLYDALRIRKITEKFPVYSNTGEEFKVSFVWHYSENKKTYELFLYDKRDKLLSKLDITEFLRQSNNFDILFYAKKLVDDYETEIYNKSRNIELLDKNFDKSIQTFNEWDGHFK